MFERNGTIRYIAVGKIVVILTLFFQQFILL